jgi:hypothetical protein
LSIALENGRRLPYFGRSNRRETAVAKGQKKSNREIRKPKQNKPKPAAATPSFLNAPSKKK